MDATLIIIADEVLIGRVTDTNTGTLARALEQIGVRLARVITVHDNPSQIEATVRCACAETPLVLTTGGLGPTKDDMTKNVLTKVFGGQLKHDSKVMENIEAIFAKKGLELNDLTRTQALVPTSCHVINNPAGTAPVMVFEPDEKTMLISMPGVPGEVKAVLPDVVRTVSTRFTPDVNYSHRTCIVTGISESALAEQLDAFEKHLAPNLHLAYLPYSPIIKLRLDGYGTDKQALNAQLDTSFAELHNAAAPYVIADGDISPAEILLQQLAAQSLTVATAESCTGGQVAAAITTVSGASAYFNGGIVAYSNEVKHGLLGVSNDTLKQYGAVSAETIEQMLAGSCRVLGTDCAIATSGIAGPGGGTPEKPVGTVWIGASCHAKTSIKCLHLRGSRTEITARATTLAILNLIQILR